MFRLSICTLATVAAGTQPRPRGSRMSVMLCIALMVSGMFGLPQVGNATQTVLGHLTSSGPVFDVSTSVLQTAIGEELADGSTIGSLALVQRSDNGKWVLTANCSKSGTGLYMVYFDLHANSQGEFTVPLTGNPKRCICSVIGCPITNPPTPYCSSTPCSGGCQSATCTESCDDLTQIGYIGSFH
jgi:hypothetical protein